MKCPYCGYDLRPGAMRFYKMRSEESESTERRPTLLCTCVRAQGMWWTKNGEVQGISMTPNVTPLDGK